MGLNYIVRLWVAYIARLTGGLHYKARMLVKAWRCMYLVLTVVLVFILDSGVPQRHCHECSLRHRAKSRLWQY
jgi:hypothetical protein